MVFLVRLSFVIGLLSATVLCADTVSETVGFVERTVAEGETVAMGLSFGVQADLFEDSGLAAMLAGDGAQGDWLHVWLGKHFGIYTLASRSWYLYGSTTRVPSVRLTDTSGSGYLVTRRTAGTTTLILAGTVSSNATETLTVPATSWRLLALPYPQAKKINEIAWSGAQEGDKLRLWNVQGWAEYLRSGGNWMGEGADTAIIPLGAAFLFYNSDNVPKSLLFNREP